MFEDHGEKRGPRSDVTGVAKDKLEKPSGVQNEQHAIVFSVRLKW